MRRSTSDGWNIPVLMAYSGHTIVASFARSASVSPEALGRLQDERDPARRR
jgi:integrase/recombinase XerC/integrase/recombinase XerD